MALNTLCAAFRRITVSQKGNLRYFRCQAVSSKDRSFLTPMALKTKDDLCKVNPDLNIKFEPRTLNIDFELPMTNGLRNNNIGIPVSRIPIIENPNKYVPVWHDLPLPSESIELPTNENIVEKQAVRMIVIRRKKMKKHKRIKLRKKMKFFWRKIKQKRELNREKAFQEEQVALIKKAESFDPAEYVMGRLKELNKEYIPRTYRGEVIPQDMIKKFIEEKKNRRAMKYRSPRLTL